MKSERFPVNFLLFCEAVINSFRGDSHRDPVESVHQMKLKAHGSAGGKRVAAIAKQHKGLSLAELSAQWTGVVKALRADGVTIINPDHALEGALLIRQARSHAIRHGVCTFVHVPVPLSTSPYDPLAPQAPCHDVQGRRLSCVP